MNQPAFEFPPPRYRPMPEHPICVLTWCDGGVRAEWPEMQTISAWFESWDAALSCVLHPLNSHVRLRIREKETP